MTHLPFVGKIRVSERAGKRGSTKYYRLRIPPEEAEILQLMYDEPLHDKEKVLVTITRVQPKKQQPGGK